MKNVYCVIMAGGVGSRFWPLSTGNHPKQFIDVLGIGETLLQSTFNRFKKIVPEENILVVTNARYTELVKEQLPSMQDDQILLEPAKRNTTPCIAYATFKVLEKNKDAVFVKMDIFKGLLWYTYKENRAKWYKLSLEQVKEIISANKNKEVVSGLEDFESEIVEVVKKELDVVGQDSLTRFDTPKARNKKKNKNKNKNKNQKVQNTSSNTQNNKQLNQGQPKRAKQNQELKNQQPERKKPVHNKPFSNKQKPNAIEGKKENIPPKGNLQSNEKSSLNQQKQLENKPKNKNRNKKRRQPKKGPNPSENA